jgi:4-diphosphocytidyl-2-C-methyl-D-erythritol kinase
MNLPSHAKINLFLKILEKRPDGFHSVQTLMLPISLHDDLIFEKLDKPEIVLESSDRTLPTDKSNLIRRAAELLQSRHAPRCGARIRLNKQIPIGAGLGGGSSNGSTTLVGLNRLWNLNLDPKTLEILSAEFGSDTAFFVQNKPALSEGRGEILTSITFRQQLPLLLMNFGFGSATGWAYKNLKLEGKSSKVEMGNFESGIFDLKSILQNDLEKPVFKKFPILQIAKDFLSAQPEVAGSMMCGSGSTMMAILKSSNQAASLEKSIRKQFGPSVWIWSGTTLTS